MDLKHLEYIVAVHDEGSISKAAKKCFVSQPTLSIHLKKLEAELGLPLFDRHGLRTIPTQAGILYVETAKQILELKRTLYSQLESFSQPETNRIALGLFQNIGSKMIAEVYPRFKDRYPRIRLDINDGRYRTLRTGLLGEALDLAIITIVQREEDFSYEEIKKEPFLLACAVDQCPDSILPMMQTREGLFSFIQNKHFILAPDDTIRREVENQFFTASGFRPQTYDQVHNIHTTLDMVEKGLGVALIPAGFFDPAKSIRPIPVPENPSWTLVAATKKGRVLSPSLKVLLQLIRAYYTQENHYRY
ncbi:LysR family transcriptional regulator [Alkalibacter rhizosphaerae]|uniref:LysR family transcriptional regulator n=1 Tax=Alkalibacter rhizosphaerae TaxID=2815577 RepID=A0A974XGH4_9FIRM|nr:LysR family transcriptional regulator [Alkalibacter rhizosphaerae]QSX09373.1 LysR family transcriptional regulator [Alkalibacter rhizosphaerae]